MTLNYSDLIDPDLPRRVAVNSGSTIEYSIFSNDNVQPGYGTSVFLGHYEYETHAHNHNKENEEFIRSVFTRLDPLIDLDFIEADTSGGQEINIYRAWWSEYWEDLPTWLDPTTRGGGVAMSNGYSYDIVWRDYYGSDSFFWQEKSTIVHEIGHALGLQHPGGDGDNPFWDSDDSIMSYNHTGSQNQWFTDLDIHALQSIWGKEPDSNSVYRLRNSQTGRYLFSSNSYEIDIITGYGWVNEGIAYVAPTVETSDLYRFLRDDGGHFYTASEYEASIVQATQGFQYEGVAFQVYTQEEIGSVAIVRYYNTISGIHLYSTSSYEQDILNSDSQWINEGIAWYGETAT